MSPTSKMNADQLHAWTTAERLGLADLLDDLGPDQWQADSPCAGWTVHVVAAHVVVGVEASLRTAVSGMVRARGDLHRMLDLISRERAARSAPDELVAQLRRDAGSRRRPPGTTPADPLVEALVHGQDVARAVGRTREVPPEPGLVALERALVGFAPAGLLDRTRLVATDADWARGSGTEVRGTLGDLLVVATGRELVGR